MAIGDDTFQPRRGLRGGHLQTLFGNFLPRENLLPPGEPQRFQVADEAEVLCMCHWQKTEPQRRGGAEEEGIAELQNCGTAELKSDSNTKTLIAKDAKSEKGDIRHDAMTVIIVHGLEGSIDSRYVIGVGSKAWARGMNVVRMNMRNCGGTEALTPTLYHSGLSDDVGAVVRRLIEVDGLERIALVGYSMGGNLVLKLAGDWADNAPPQLKAVCGVSPAMDLAPSADALHEPKNRVYEWKFLRGLKRRFERKAQLFPTHYDARDSRWFGSIREFDHEITAKYSGFASADDYYARASSANVVDQIRVPTLVLHALDDPFIRVLPETRRKLEANPSVKYIETKHGGHCAFLENPPRRHGGTEEGKGKQHQPQPQNQQQPRRRGDAEKSLVTAKATPTPDPTLSLREGWGTREHPYDGRWAEQRCIEFIASQNGSRD